MRRKVLFFFILIAVAVVIVFAGRVLAGRSPKQGKLKITTTPVTSVFIDNKHVGRTPYEEAVNAGDVTVKLVPESTVMSVASWQGKVTIAPSTLTFINRELTDSELTSSGEVLWLEKITSRQSEVDVVSNPDGASVLLDDALKGISPLNIPDVTPADHTLTITSPGFVTKSLKIKTTAGYKVKISLQLALGSGTPVPTPSPVLPASPTPVISVSPAATPTASLKITPTKSITPSVRPSTTPVASPTNPPKPFITIQDTPTGFLNVRSEPNSSSSDLGDVKPGDKFSVEDSRVAGGVTWYQIRYDGTNLGWVSGTYATLTE